MNSLLRSFRIGQQVWATVEENIALDEVIINFGGDLLRVKNESKLKLRAGQRVHLLVEETHPLKLKLLHKRNRNTLHIFDLNI